MSALPRPITTEADYLKVERASENSHEYVAGEAFDSAGGAADTTPLIQT